MSIESAGLEDEEYWGLDQEIEQIERMWKVWQHQAEMHPNGLLSDSINRIAAGYALHLEILQAERS
jgi:hypothetical protein